MRFCACVITYHPDVELLQRNVAAYYAFAEKIIIWRNSEESDFGIDDPQGKVSLMGNGQNEGISKAVNHILDWCSENGYEWLLTMDQDSVFDNFSHYADLVEKLSADESIAEFSPEVNETTLADGETAFVKYVITSGAFLRVSDVVKLGGFRPDFFLDCIDIDFGYKLNNHKYKVCKVGGSLLQQQFGEASVKNNHTAHTYPSTRIYNIIRNYWVVISDYFPSTLPLAWEVMKIWNFYTPASVIVYQDKKMARLGAILKGNLSGLGYLLSRPFCRKEL